MLEPFHFERPAGCGVAAYAMASGFGGGLHGRMRNATRDDGKPLARPALQGLAVICGQDFGPTSGRDEIVHLMPGALDESIRDGHEIHLLVEHQDGNHHGSTRSGLQIEASHYGVAFRYELDGGGGEVLSAMVGSGARASASVGLRNLQGYRQQTDDGEVFFITRADLVEISIVESGACVPAFVSVVDLADEHADLRDTLASIGFRMDRLAASSAKLDRLLAKTRRLLADDAPSEPRSIHTDTMNRWQTAEVEALQEWARSERTVF